MLHHIETIDSGSGAQTDTEVLAAPGVGKAYVIRGFYCSSDAAITIDLEHGSSLLHRQYVAANSGQIPAFAGGNQALWRADENTAVTYTTSGAANVVVEVWYDIVGA